MGLPKPDRIGTKSSNQKKLNFIKLSEGRHTIRMLQPLDEVKLSYTHWVRGTSLECPGESCPICKNNQEILMSVNNEWEDAKKVKGFNPWQVRYYANVLDRTLVKVSPQSEIGFENKRRPDGSWPIVCEDTGELLEGIPEQPSNTVKILSGGKTLFGDLENIDLATLGQDESPLGIENYDVVLMVSGEGRERKVSPVPQVSRNDVIDLEDLELYDLDRAIITFTADEITDFLNGTSLSDIFAARRVSDNVAEVDDEEVEKDFVEESEQTEELTNSINRLLGK